MMTYGTVAEVSQRPVLSFCHQLSSSSSAEENRKREEEVL